MKKAGNPPVSAVIVAAGQGRRMNADKNKQYIEIAGKPVLARTLEVFQECSCIDEIILVVNSQDILFCKQDIVDFYGITKVKSLVAGGRERQESVYNGLLEVDGKCGIVLIHDGARPFVSVQSIQESVEAAREYGASCVAVPVKDTIKTADGEGFIDKTLDRTVIWSIQTPQTFKYELVMKAHNAARAEGFSGTDDAVLVERLGVRTRLVMGDYTNIKITTPEDLIFGEAIAAEYD